MLSWSGCHRNVRHPGRTLLLDVAAGNRAWARSPSGVAMGKAEANKAKACETEA